MSPPQTFAQEDHGQDGDPDEERLVEKGSVARVYARQPLEEEDEGDAAAD